MKSSLLFLLLVISASRCTAHVAITTLRLPNGTVDTPYSAVIEASGGCTPYKWSIPSGALPAAVTARVSSTTASLKLIGTPTAPGTDSFEVKVTGCSGYVSKVSYKVVIQHAANHVVDLRWEASTSKDVAGYNVYRISEGSSTWKRINASLIASTLYSDSTIADNTTYFYAATTVSVDNRESRKTDPIKVVIP